MDGNVNPGRHDTVLADIARLSGAHIDLDALLDALFFEVGAVIIDPCLVPVDDEHVA